MQIQLAILMPLQLQTFLEMHLILIPLIYLGINGLGNETVIISDTSIDSSLLNTLDENTTGEIDASTLKTLTGDGVDALTKSFNSKEYPS